MIAVGKLVTGYAVVHRIYALSEIGVETRRGCYLQAACFIGRGVVLIVQPISEGQLRVDLPRILQEEFVIASDELINTRLAECQDRTVLLELVSGAIGVHHAEKIAKSVGNGRGIGKSERGIGARNVIQGSRVDVLAEAEQNAAAH